MSPPPTASIALRGALRRALKASVRWRPKRRDIKVTQVGQGLFKEVIRRSDYEWLRRHLRSLDHESKVDLFRSAVAFLRDHQDALSFSDSKALFAALRPAFTTLPDELAEADPVKRPIDELLDPFPDGRSWVEHSFALEERPAAVRADLGNSALRETLLKFDYQLFESFLPNDGWRDVTGTTLFAIKDCVFPGSTHSRARFGYAPVSQSGHFAPRLLCGQKPKEVLSFEFAVDLEVREEIDLGFVVPGAYGNGYYHVIQNSLPNLAIYKELGLTCPILLPAIDGRRFPAALEALTLLLRHLGLTDRVLYSGSEVTGLRVKHAVAPVILPVSAYGIALWRDLYDGLGPAPDETRPAKKIYVTRGGAGRRRIVNERKVERRMKRAGFRVIDLERLSFLEQARIFRSAGTIVAPHGAGLVHLCFCEPGTRLIEIATKPWLPPFPNICRLAGLEYIPIIPEIVGAEGRSWDMNEFQAPLDRLMRVLGALDAA